MTSRRQFVGNLLGIPVVAQAAGLLPARLYAQSAPAKPTPMVRQLTIVVGYPPGGATDAVARLVAEALRGTYADNVIVDNRAGAGGRIAAAYVKERPADGSFLLYTPAFPLVIYPPHLQAAAL